MSDALRKIGRARASHFNVHAVLEYVDGDNEDDNSRQHRRRSHRRHWTSSTGQSLASP
jgi:hypothetical protein